MSEFDLLAQTPDEFLMDLVNEHPVKVLDVVLGLVRRKTRPQRTYEEVIAGLRRCGLPRFADWLAS